MRSPLLGKIYLEIKSFFSSKSSVFWVIGWPILMIVVTAYVFVPPGTGAPITLNVGVVNLDHSNTSFNGSTLVSIMEEVKYQGKHLFKVSHFNSKKEMMNKLRKGNLEAGILIPNGFGKNLTTGSADLYIYVLAANPSSYQVNYGILSSFMQNLNYNLSRYKINLFINYLPKGIKETKIYGVPFSEFLSKYLIGISKPINATYQEIVPNGANKLTRPYLIGWYAVGAIGMMMLYSGLNYGASALSVERERGSLKRVLSTPLSYSGFLASIYISSVILLGISAIIAAFFAIYVCGAQISWSPTRPEDWIAILDAALMALMILGMGAILSLAAKRPREASTLGTSLGLVLSFTAGIWFPLSWMPKPLQEFAQIFPPTWATNLLRDTIVYHQSLSDVLGLLIKVIVATAVFVAISWAIYKARLRKYLEG